MGLLGRLLRQTAVPSITAGGLTEKQNNGESYVILDVREAEEWEVGHIPGATWIPLGELPGRLHELPQEREIVCVCRSGNRSAFATQLLATAGYKATNLRGGMLDWSGDLESEKHPT